MSRGATRDSLSFVSMAVLFALGCGSDDTKPSMPTARAHLDGRNVVLDIVSEQDLEHDGCEPLSIEKHVDKKWQPRRDERPQRGSGESYYLDGEFVSQSEDSCFEVNCETLDEGISARAEEFVQTGTKRPPAGEPDPEIPVVVVETRPLTGLLRLSAHYYFAGPDSSCDAQDQRVATAELIVPAD